MLAKSTLRRLVAFRLESMLDKKLTRDQSVHRLDEGQDNSGIRHGVQGHHHRREVSQWWRYGHINFHHSSTAI